MEWLQPVKEVSFQTDLDFRSALLHRSAQEVTNIIRSLPEDISHDKLIEEILCCFSGIPNTAAAIDELAKIRQQPGQNLHVYINKYKELHFWCTKKLPHHENYKLTLSSFSASLQDPIGRKLSKKLWDERERQKLTTLQVCFNEAHSVQKGTGNHGPQLK